MPGAPAASGSASGQPGALLGATGGLDGEQEKQVQRWRRLLLNLREARVVMEDFRRDDNQDRPQSKLGYLSPNQWIENQSASPDSTRPAGLAASRLVSSENIN